MSEIKTARQTCGTPKRQKHPISRFLCVCGLCVKKKTTSRNRQVPSRTTKPPARGARQQFTCFFPQGALSLRHWGASWEMLHNHGVLISCSCDDHCHPQNLVNEKTRRKGAVLSAPCLVATEEALVPLHLGGSLPTPPHRNVVN